MNRTLIIAWREFRQISSTRAFRFTLIGLPLLVAASLFISAKLRPPVGEGYIILDRSGQYEAQLVRRIEIDYQRGVLARLSTHARDRGVKAPAEVWGSGPRWFSDAEVSAFIAAGGAEAALPKIQAASPGWQGAAFSPPERRFLRAAPPASLGSDPTADAFLAALAPHLKKEIATPVGPRRLTLAVYIPADYGQGPAPAQVWTNGRPNPYLLNLIQTDLSRVLKLRLLQQTGLDPAAAARLEAVSAPLTIITPPAREARSLSLRSALPVAMSYILLMTLIMSGSMMLQGVVEEKSNKLLEAILACVTPDEIMGGKLLGICAIGLTTVITWTVFAGVAGAFAPGDLAESVRAAFTAINSPLTALAVIFYYLAGYLVLSMLFLAVGALSESMQDAQGYLTPLMLAIMLPFSALVPAVSRDPHGMVPMVMSWIPLYTPFAMLMRLGSGVSTLEVLGTGALLVAFAALEFILLGRVFRAAILRTGQPLKLAGIGRLMMAKGPD